MIRNTHMTVNGHRIGPGCPVYVVAELSANHNRDPERALAIVRAAAAVGADAIKLQTYEPGSITLDCRDERFRVQGTIWDGRNLFELFAEAYTPREWHPMLFRAAADLGLDAFSTPFDESAVDFLETLNVPAYKVASFELVDIPLIERVGRTGKPAIVSTGMASLGEIEEALTALSRSGGNEAAVLWCVSAYPAPAEAMNLRGIPHLSETFSVPAGLSDHSLSPAVPVAATALGACIIEKHLTLSRADGGPDSAFSLEPEEFAAMVRDVHTAQAALGRPNYGACDAEAESKKFRRSLFVARDMSKGEVFSQGCIRSVRPADGLHPRHLADILGHKAAMDLKKGRPVSWDIVAPGTTEEHTP